MPKTLLRFHLALACIAVALVANPPSVRAGADMMDEAEDHHDEGPSYFGFVRDGRGVPLADAKVTANVKNGLSFITRSNSGGLYKFSGFSKQINPDDVTITCAKDGYKQTRVLRKPVPKTEVKAVETECRLERS